MNLDSLLKSKRFKKVLARLYGIGASVVVLGALFKIQHWNGAGFMLGTGLITEAIIFFFYAFDDEEEPIRVFPEILSSSRNKSEEHSSLSENRGNAIGNNGGSIALAKFDKMLEEAEITPDMLMELGLGMKKLGETTENLNSMDNISHASRRYMRTIKSADESLEKLAKTYENSIAKITCNTVFKYKSIANSLSTIEEESRSYQQQMEVLNRNISHLNTVYKMQRKEAEYYLEDMKESSAESKKYRKQMAELNDNLAELNKFYRKMLSAAK
jgi:gliding motility-associated protein GldL